MQVDFAKAALTRTSSGRYRRPYLFKAVLSYSRHSYEEVVWRQDLASFIRCPREGRWTRRRASPATRASVITGPRADCIPIRLRRVGYRDRQSGRHCFFITNIFHLSAQDVAALYKALLFG